MEQTLTLEDYEVEVFDNPVKALDYLGNDPDFAVIISDYRMPEIHGIEFLARSREIAPRAVRMMLTAYGNTVNFNDARKKVKLFNYLSKPIGPDELVFQVERAIEQYELQTDQRCRDLDEEEDDWLEDEEREPALLLCHLFGRPGFGTGESEEAMHLSAWCYDLVSQISKKYMGQMFNQEGEAAISMYEDIEPDGAAIKAVKAALEAADLIREELTVKEEVGLGCYLVISVGPVSFSYDDREESQSIEGRSLDLAKEAAQLDIEAPRPVEIILTGQAREILSDWVEEKNLKLEKPNHQEIYRLMIGD